MRGDVILKFDGVELLDIANNRIGSNHTSEAVMGDVAPPIEGAVFANGGDAKNTEPEGNGASLGDTDTVNTANEEEHAPNLGDLNHDEVGEHTPTAEEKADRADAEALNSENSMFIRPLVGDSASSKLVEGSVPAESDVIAQTEQDALSGKPDEPDS
jgi:hypothetical protein